MEDPLIRVIQGPKIPDLDDITAAVPTVTIFVRHSADCRHNGNPGFKGCRCRKHLRWFQSGKQHFQAAGTRSWTEAEKKKREVEDRLAGRTLAPLFKPNGRLTIAEACDKFMAAKRNDGLERSTIGKLQKTVDRIAMFCAADKLEYLEQVDLTHVATWEWSKFFNTTHSLRVNQEKVKSFFRYFHNAGLISRNPAASWKRVKGRVEQVQGFTPKEFENILAAIPKTQRKTTYSASDKRRNIERMQMATPELQHRLRALVLLMRYAGLAIIDASCLERVNVYHKGDMYRIQLKTRQKTSKRETLQPIDNAIPPFVGKELLNVLNGNPRYVFWNRGEYEGGSDEAEKRQAVKYWQKWVRALLDTAGLPNATSHMFRHTLAIEMIRHGATFEDVAAALGNTVGVVAKFYSHEWAKVRRGHTDAAIQAAW